MIDIIWIPSALNDLNEIANNGVYVVAVDHGRRLLPEDSISR